MIKQLELDLKILSSESQAQETSFSVKKTSEDLEKISLLDKQLIKRFQNKLINAPFLTRKLVSFQANKSRPIYRWYKYKEAFSADLVEHLLREYDKEANVKKLLDPFAGSGTALFAASNLGIESHGIELLPIGQCIINARYLLEQKFTEKEFLRLEFWKNEKPWNSHNLKKSLPELRITEGAYLVETKNSIEKYLYSIEEENQSVREVLLFALLCVLENVSLTRKDGQCLRWDYRAERKYVSDKFNNGDILDFDTAIVTQIENILEDTIDQNKNKLFDAVSTISPIYLMKGSCLDLLPTLKDESFEAIITSPPYCNRYDYTRTYALELALLGITEEEIVKLRQTMLSCTVENREKLLIKDNLFWQRAIDACNNQTLLQAILSFLNKEREGKRLNNSGIPRMVKGYFYEMACVIAECARVLKKEAPLFMVNDNVSYAGAQISVDLILSDIGQQLGFEIEAILVMPNGKGNSSQQMGVHGRTPLRKCIYVWRKI